MKKLILIGVALLLVVGMAITGVTLLNTDKNVTLRSIQNFAEGLMEREEISPIIKTLSGGSVEASLDKIVDTEYSENLLEDTFISGKIYFSKNAIMLSDFNSKIYGTKIAGDLYVSEDVIYVNEENILKGAYGVQLSTLTEDLKESIFAPDSNSNYAIDEEIFDQIIEALESANNAENIEKDLEKLLKTVIQDVIDIIFENAEVESKTASIRLNGEKTKVRQIVIVIDADAMQSIIHDVYDYLCDSEDIIDFINEYEDLIISALNDAYDDEEYDSLEEAYKDMLDEYEEDIDDVCDSIDENYEDISVKIATPLASAKLLKLEVEAGKETVLVLDCGKQGIKKTDSISISFYEELEISYDVVRSDKKSFEAKACVEYYSGQYDILLNINKEKGNYTVKYEDSYNNGDSFERYNIKGSYLENGDCISFSIDEIKNTYSWSDGSISEETYKIGCQITVDTKDNMPEPIKDFESLSDIKEGEFEKWLEKIDEIF